MTLPSVETPGGRARSERSVRQRAPRRGGRRTQVTVPEAIWAEVCELAAASDTTPNDVLLRLACERLEQRRREAELHRRAEQRWQGFLDSTQADDDSSVEPLTEEELLDILLASRYEDD